MTFLAKSNFSIKRVLRYGVRRLVAAFDGGTCHAAPSTRPSHPADVRADKSARPKRRQVAALHNSFLSSASPFVATLLLACVLLAPGCGAPKDDRTPDGRTIVTYWEKWTGFELEAMQSIVNDFNRSQNRIEVRLLAVSQIDVKLLLAVSGGNPPDLAGLWTYSVPDFSEKSALTPLDTAITEAGIKAENYIPIFWDMCRHRDLTWGLPLAPASTALFYNRSLFREAGLDPSKPPRTIAELEEFNDKLTLVDITRNGRTERVTFDKLTPAERDAVNFSVVRVGHLPQEPGWWVMLWGYWFGGKLFDDDKKITATAPGNIAAFKWLEYGARRYGVDNLRSFRALAGVTASPQNPFMNGTVAMEIQGVWMHNFIERFAPGLDWDVAAFPGVDANSPPISYVESDIICVPKGAKHPREAFEFIAYLQTREVAEKLALGQRKFTALTDVSRDFIKNHPNPHIQTFIDLAKSPGAFSIPRLSIWREYEAELRIAAERITNLAGTPQKILGDVEKRVQWRFDRVLRRWEAVHIEREADWREIARETFKAPAEQKP